VVNIRNIRVHLWLPLRPALVPSPALYKFPALRNDALRESQSHNQ